MQPSTAALTDAFAALKTAGATELVLDLRYNGGGLVDVAVHLASLIGGTRTNGQVMLNYVHNDKIGPTLNKTTRFANPEQALNLQRLVVITTRGSASASELVINSLRPYMPVTIIGDTTYGKPVGQYGLRLLRQGARIRSRSRSRTRISKATFSTASPVDCAAGDDYTHQLGDAAEASFAEALTFIRTGACSARAATEARALRAPQVHLPADRLGVDPQRPVDRLPELPDIELYLHALQTAHRRSAARAHSPRQPVPRPLVRSADRSGQRQEGDRPAPAGQAAGVGSSRTICSSSST